MEAIQAYYLNKSQNKMPVQTRRNAIRKIAISWALEAMKTVLGYEEVRNTIIKYYYPQIDNPEEMRTFDAFQQYDTPPFIDKALEITDYCEDVIEDDGVEGIVVMTAANIQISPRDNMTHYQSFIIDKDEKRVYAVDPAAKAQGFGIYEAAVSQTIVFPIFRSHGYKCEFVSLTHPAQSNKGDVFCQTWTLVILLKVLEKIFQTGEKKSFSGAIDIPAPRPKINKYKMLLEFFKNILENIPSVGTNLGIEFLEIVYSNKEYISEYCAFEKIVDVDVVELFGTMSAEDMMY